MHDPRRPEVGQAPTYIDVPAGQARWRLAQLHAADVHTRAEFDAGRARLGPLTPAEYAAAWAAMAAQRQPVERTAAAAGRAVILLCIALGLLAALGWVALPALVVLMGGALAALVVAMAALALSAARGMRLGRRHPDPALRRMARLVWWAPWAGWGVVALFGLAMAAAAALWLP